ncbi:conserved hypothetical protein [Candidatus Desulfarcum epimagneticum]|uniref:Winged helix-turn helix domain-containing protein n=1 Tax=uncultured Desulfobacteraceae bacterium TaxID=218296 RepID=A0A484HJ66_9BACT|nr:conserved hypothetical protein [uncultured Desulfobacteraceae bacterium]
MIKINLTRRDRIELESFRRLASSKDSEKALMVLMSADRRSVSEISRLLRRHPHTVRDWLKRYKNKGLPGLSRKFSPGRPDEKRQKVKERIKEILADPPLSYGYVDNVWTVALIAFEIKKSLKLKVSGDTVKRALKNLGYSYKRPSKSPPAKAPSREEKVARINKMVEKIKSIAIQKDCEIFALDESHFSTEPYLVQGWFLKRWPPQDMLEFQKRKSHILWMLEFKNTKILLEEVSQGQQP